MSDELHATDIQSISGILQASMNIQSGSKGVDFFVLVNDDEMCGYRMMPLEAAFCDAVKQTVELLSEHGVDFSPRILSLGV